MLKRILTFYTKYFAIWVVLCGIIAYFHPDIFITIEQKTTWFFAVTIERLLPQAFHLKKGREWFFALTMFGIGAILKMDDFKNILRTPLIVLIGSAAQFTIMPLGAFFLAKLFHLPPEIAVGLIITGAAPGAMASNLMSYIAKADTAYSVSLTTVSTLACPLFTPGLTLILAGSMMEIPFLSMFIYVLMIVVIPLFIGFGVRHILGNKIQAILPVFPAISVTFIIFICSFVIAVNQKDIAQISGIIVIAGIILNIYGMLAGYGVASLFRMNIQRRRTLAIEIGMQNAGLGSMLALDHFGNQAAIPGAIFAFICIVTASALAAFWQRMPLIESAD
ncbi:MAG: bile acid:sodium symporter family protein [Sedimentisphaerales bacterium]|nr:bile acid:sodium symporter family protein [Sedimentisphaerales bacterium]